MQTIKEAFPDLLTQVSLTLNTPSQVEKLGSKAIESASKLWWTCSKYPDHVWLASIRSRAFNNQGCQICDDKVVFAGFNDLETKFPEIAKEWHPDKNNGLKPSEITWKNQIKKFWWLCPEGHDYDMLVGDRTTRNRSCPICKNKKLVPGLNDLATEHPDLIKQWHPTKNDDLLPANFTSGSRIKVWWLSEQCGHEWFMAIDKRTTRGQGCSVCAGKVVISSVSLATTHPDLAAEWHSTKNGDLTPEQVSPGSHTRVWWQGKACGHTWDSIVKTRALSGHGCPVCAGKRIITGVNSLAATFPLVAKEWHPTLNEAVTPEDRVAGSRKMAWWICAKGHEWKATPENRTRSGSGCPSCYANTFVSKAELAISDWLKSLNLNVKTTVYGLVKNREIDIYLPDQNIAIEFNGLYWHNENSGKAKQYHYDKWKACKDKGIQLIQIWEDEWNRNPELVKSMLSHKLGVSQQRKVSGHKTEVVELTNEQCAVFLNANHIQGTVGGGVRLGLVEKGNPDMVLAVMVLKSEPGSGGKVLNLLRFATSVTVVGGFTKLLKYAERNFNPDSIITFSDNCVSDGGLYRNNGFVAVKELEPDYKYVVKSERVHKFRYRLKRFKEDPNLQYEEGLSERELALLNRIPRIWDAGKTKWEKIC